jgi:hypothetical protein
MTIALPISRLINASVVLSPALAQQANFNSLMVLGTSTVIDVASRLRAYGSLAAIATDFGTASEEYLAAVRWFGQAPQPTSLIIGRWAKTASNGQLVGGPVSIANQSMTVWNAIVAGAAFVTVDGVPISLQNLNFGASANMNGVAGVIQAALIAAGANAASTVTWDSVNQRLVVTSGTTGVTSSVSLFTPPRASGNITFAVQPLANATVTLNGTVVTFVAGAPVGNQVQIAGTLALTLAALVTFANASVDANISQATYSASATKLYVVSKVTGVGGNAFTLAASVAVPSGATLVGGSGTDTATPAALITGSGAYVANGIAAETALAAVTIMDNLFSNLWYGLAIPSGSVADHVAVMNFINSDTNLHFYGVTSQDPNEIVPSQTTSLGYLLKQQAANNGMWQYSSTDPYAVVSALARILTTNWNGSNTALSLMYKQEPGVTPEQLTLTQVNALEANNGNVFVAYNNGTAILETGICPSGQFVDTIIGIDWLVSFIQTNLFNVLYGSTTKIPQTDAGNAILAASIESSCSQAVANGLLGPGVWNASGFGQLKTGDTLPKGFYVYAPPIALQAPADRAARKSVAFQVAAKLAGAINTASVVINVNN